MSRLFTCTPGLPGKFVQRELCVGERVDRIAETVAAHAHRPDHLLVGPQVVVLVVLDQDRASRRLRARGTRRAAGGSSRRRRRCRRALRPRAPSSTARSGASARTPPCAGRDGSRRRPPPRPSSCRSGARRGSSCTTSSLSLCLGVHRLARAPGVIGVSPSASRMPCLPARKPFVSGSWQSRAGLVIGTFHPRLGAVLLRLVAAAAVDARLRVGGREPVRHRPRASCMRSAGASAGGLGLERKAVGRIAGPVRRRHRGSCAPAAAGAAGARARPGASRENPRRARGCRGTCGSRPSCRCRTPCPCGSGGPRRCPCGSARRNRRRA